MPENLTRLLAAVRACRDCEGKIPQPRPILNAHRDARVLIVGQAPGRKVHATGIPWNDASGERLRAWLNVDKPTFYNPRYFAIIPIGFCFPGTGRSGDLPPRRECGELWIGRLLAALPRIELKILIGHYAQAYYLGERRKPSLTETVRHWRDYWPGHLPLPHSSPHNIGWFKANPWLKQEVIPALRRHPAMRAIYKETR
ncbi:MAG: uracil-DNA glycosylase family protein [Gammaproteobacteria bacterium]|nr:uracil-DNA glycosylase family protein [Gammaproteobacteria bacterium]MBU6510619.1 uracil-DNA glycosylase family protein [Gammaproteobacteria bacterium]